MAGLRRGKAMEEALKNVEDHILFILYNKFPPYFKTTEKKLMARVIAAAEAGVARYSLLCSGNNQSRAARRCGTSRTNMGRIVKVNKIVIELEKY